MGWQGAAYYGTPTELHAISGTPTTTAAGSRSDACSRRPSSPVPTPWSACASTRTPTNGPDAQSTSWRLARPCGSRRSCARARTRCSPTFSGQEYAKLAAGRGAPGRHRRVHERPLCAGHVADDERPAHRPVRRHRLGQPGARRLQPRGLCRSGQGDGRRQRAGARTRRRRGRRRAPGAAQQRPARQARHLRRRGSDRDLPHHRHSGARDDPSASPQPPLARPLSLG